MVGSEGEDIYPDSEFVLQYGGEQNPQISWDMQVLLHRSKGGVLHGWFLLFSTYTTPVHVCTMQCPQSGTSYERKPTPLSPVAYVVA